MQCVIPMICCSMLFFCMRLKNQSKNKCKENCRSNTSCCCRKSTSENTQKTICFHRTNHTFCKRSTKANDWDIHSSTCKIRDIVIDSNRLQKDPNQFKCHQNSGRSNVCCDDQKFTNHTNCPTN